METSANDVLVAKLEQERTFNSICCKYVVKVDMQNKQIIVDWGLP